MEATIGLIIVGIFIYFQYQRDEARHALFEEKIRQEKARLAEDKERNPYKYQDH